MVTDAVLTEVERINATQVRARVRLKLTRRIRDFLSAREASGDRSDVLWEIETSLAAVGCSVAEIIAVVRSTVWNKYEGRADEMKRLLIEATKASSKVSKQEHSEELEKEAQRAELDQIQPQPLHTLLINIKPPSWLVKGVLTEGAVGFIAGEPKSFKSWFGLDLGRLSRHRRPFPQLLRRHEARPSTLPTGRGPGDDGQGPQDEGREGRSDCRR
jgi:hypothetical protein